MEKTTLNEHVATELGGALQRIAELSGKKIIESTDAAEKRGLEAFVQRVMVEHAAEFVGCWLAMRTQYRPLIQGFAGLMRNCLEMIDRENKSAQPEPAPENTKPVGAGVCCQGGQCDKAAK